MDGILLLREACNRDPFSQACACVSLPAPHRYSTGLHEPLTGQRHIIRYEVRELILLAGPVVGMQLGQISNGFIDVLMVGRLGPNALAGVALGNATLFFFLLVCLGIVIAVSPMVSQAFGAGERASIGNTVQQGLWLGVILTVPLVILLWNIAPIWRLLQQDEATVVLGEQYLRAVLWGFLPFLWFIALRSFVEAVSRPWPITFIVFIGVGLNILANSALMYGKWGFPELGLVGCGWATTIVFWFIFLVLAAYVALQPRFREFALVSRFRWPDTGLLRELWWLGLPIGVSYGIEVALFAGTAFLVGTLGPTPLAAHQVAIQCASVTFMVPMGIGIATSVRVGHAVGRGDADAAAWAGRLGMVLSALFMLCAATVFWIMPRSIVGLYLDLGDVANAETAAVAVSLLGIAAVFQFFDGVQVSAAGALRGLKDTRVPMVLCFVSYWVLGFPTSVYLGYGLGWGAQGFWWGFVLGLTAASLLLSVRFARRVRWVDEP